jgi:hypothetical protein
VFRNLNDPAQSFDTRRRVNSTVRPAFGTSMDNELEAYRQAFESLRHFSNLRFAMVTVFVTITGGLFYLAFGRARRLKHGFLFTCVAGVIIAVAFGILEQRTNEILEFYANKTVELGKQLQMTDLAVSRPSRATRAARLAEYALPLVYFGTMALWVAAPIVMYAFRNRRRNVVGPERGRAHAST